MSENNIPFPINYSCHFSEFREGEQFARIHSLGLVLSGEMELNDGITKKIFKEGELYSARKNHLLKFAKYPPKNGEIRTISIYFDDAMLHDFSREYGYQAEKKDNIQAYIKPEQKALHSFMYSLLPYEDLPASEEILRLKQKEALLLLLNYDPGLKDILFDFPSPIK
ncbi:hypothetical protein [Chryseobacterium sp. 2VB]|uniref:hypothetical protein n=1 Tax=Chryseobacterium sp. 2VB TaxID=2502204 RepID=UPI001E42D560|nr:hypothetical protein [Chryseobacterium sp. 2VB]